jgi:hypothetical protein
MHLPYRMRSGELTSFRHELFSADHDLIKGKHCPAVRKQTIIRASRMDKTRTLGLAFSQAMWRRTFMWLFAR